MTLFVSGQAVFNCWKEKRQLLSAWSATDRNFSQITLWLGRRGEIFLNGHPERVLLPSDKAETRGMAAGWTEPCCSHLVSFLCQGSHSMAAFAQREARLSTDPKLGPLLTPAWFWRAGREPLLLHRAGGWRAPAALSAPPSPPGTAIPLLQGWWEPCALTT